jgi:uroporphyrinogen decarboxylase
MNARENLHQMLRREAPERVPFDIWGVVGPVADEIERRRFTRDLNEALDCDIARVIAGWPQDPEAWRQGFREIGWHLADDPTLQISGFGITHQAPPVETLGDGAHFRSMLHPLEGIQSVEQLERLPWPDVSQRPDDADLADRVRAYQERGLAVAAQGECTLFEHAWYVRGMDMLFMDLMEENGISDWLLDYFTQRSCTAMISYCEAGVDVIQLGDDVGTQRGLMMAPDYWREHLKPRLARVVGTIRKHQKRHTWVFYHSDGDVEPIIEDLIEIGIDILNPVQPECMDAAKLAEQYGGRIAFWGMVGTQTTMPFGSPQDVRDRVAQIVDLAQQGASVVVAPTHVIEPEVPWENILALVDAAAEAKLGPVANGGA